MSTWGSLLTPPLFFNINFTEVNNMAIVNIRDTGRNSARTNDVRELATKVKNLQTLKQLPQQIQLPQQNQALVMF